MSEAPLQQPHRRRSSGASRRASTGVNDVSIVERGRPATETSRHAARAGGTPKRHSTPSAAVAAAADGCVSGDSSPIVPRRCNGASVSLNTTPRTSTSLASRSARTSIVLPSESTAAVSPCPGGVVHRGRTSLLAGSGGVDLRRCGVAEGTARSRSLPARLSGSGSHARCTALAAGPAAASFCSRPTTSDTPLKGGVAVEADTLVAAVPPAAVSPTTTATTTTTITTTPRGWLQELRSSAASAPPVTALSRSPGAVPRATESTAEARPSGGASSTHTAPRRLSGHANGHPLSHSPEPVKPAEEPRRSAAPAVAASALSPPEQTRAAPAAEAPVLTSATRGDNTPIQRVPGLDLAQLQSPSAPPPPPPSRQAATRRSRGGHPMSLSRPGGADPEGAAVAVVESPPPPEAETPPPLSTEFMSCAVLAMNEVHAMESDPAAAEARHSHGVDGSRSGDSGVGWRPWVQRGASTPRPSVAPAERRSHSASPVMRALRGKALASGPSTPRLSTSTPPFTVATVQNSLSYTARLSREGSTSSTAGAAPPAAASAGAARDAQEADGADVVAAMTAGDGSARSSLHRGSVGSLGATGDAPSATDDFANAVLTSGESQDYVAAVADHVARHYYVVLTALEIGRGAALQQEPPHALCLRSMVVDLNTVATLLSYDSRHGVHDLLFDDCVFATVDYAWVRRLACLTALRFRGPSTTATTVNRILSCAPAVRALTLISTSHITSLSGLSGAAPGLQSVQLIHTDFSTEAYKDLVNCLSLRQLMFLQVQRRINVFDLLNTNHLTDVHLVGCPNVYYHDVPRTEWLSLCSPRQAEPALTPTSPADPSRCRARSGESPRQEQEQKQRRRQRQQGARRPGRSGSVGASSSSSRSRSTRPGRALAFPLRSLVLADCPGVQLCRLPLEEFPYLAEVSVLYQRGVRAADLAGVLELGRLRTLRLQQVFVDAELVERLQRCTRLQELNLSFCRGMRGVQALWPAIAPSLRLLNVSYSDVDDAGLAGLDRCAHLVELYARGCAYVRDASLLRRLPPSVALVDLTDCGGLLNSGLGEAFTCTGLRRLILDGCTRVRDVSGLRSLEALEELSLARTSVDDEALATLAASTASPVLRTLTSLNLSECRCLNALASFVSPVSTSLPLRQLATLCLSRSSINNDGVAHLARAVGGVGVGGLAGAAHLHELDLSHCSAVSAIGPLGAVRSLRVLNLSFSSVGDDGVAAYVAASLSWGNKELRVLEMDGCTGVCNVGCLSQLPRLAVLHLSGSSLDGPLSFEGLARCPALERLDLSECMHIDSIASLVRGLARLRVLNASLTDIGDDSVAACGALAELEELQLSGCARVTCLTALGTLPLLRRVNLSATGVVDVAPLALCPDLWDLSVSACEALTSLRPLATARALQRIDASNTPITADSFADPWVCAALEELDLHGCTHLHSIGAGALRQLRSLRRVNLSNSGVDDGAVDALAECVQLRELRLDGTPITSLSALGAAPSLQWLSACGTPVTDDGVVGLAQSECLTTLDLSSCASVCDVSPLRTLHSLARLLVRDSGVSDSSFASTWLRSGVRELDVTRCAGVREPAAVRTMRMLEHVAAGGSGLSDAGVRLLAQCSSLRRLDVSRCADVSDLSPVTMLDGLTHLDASASAVAVLAQSADALVGWSDTSRLRHLALRACASLTDVSAARHLTSLAVLDLSGSGVADVSFADSWAGCTSLEEVTLSDCRSVQRVGGVWAAPHLLRVSLARSTVAEVTGAEAAASLEVVDVSGCAALKDIAPLRALPRLQQLQGRGSAVADVSFASPWTAPSLLEVNLSASMNLRDVTALGSLPSLRHADFSGTYVVDEGVRGLVEAPMLERLDLRECTRLAHLVSLARAPHLRVLYLSRTCVGNFTFSSVSRCRQLEVLEMEECPYTSNVFVMFELGQLRSLTLPPLSRLVGSVLQTCRSLEQLFLRGCPESFEVRSFAVLPRLRVLDMRESAIKTHVLAALDNCPALEELDVSYCPQLTSLQEMGALPRLRCVAAAGLPITDESCQKLTSYPLVEKLILAECTQLRDVSALRGLPQLRHLDVSESGITAESLHGIRDIRTLEELSIRGCAALNSCRLLSEAPATGTVSVRLPRLRLVDLCGTAITSDAEVAALRRRCPLLTTVYMDHPAVSAPTSSALERVWRRLTRRVW
ncbi:Leucine Rich repeat/Leucine rich repeat [Novymonas esmeraldas]|uniref:Leucine Rich repeat/Leucine rich repeat n=1 Tax=Novymonas esmeraldas TaxID=1808958 RepID=A0AAW0F6N9_9TRYP